MLAHRAGRRANYYKAERGTLTGQARDFRLHRLLGSPRTVAALGAGGRGQIRVGEMARPLGPREGLAPVGRLLPLRRPPGWSRARNTVGNLVLPTLWGPTTLQFESLAEAGHLLRVGQSMGVAAAAAQPMVLTCSEESTGLVVQHIPDFLFQLVTGELLLVDVHRPEPSPAAVASFLLTRAWAQQQGIGYELWAPLADQHVMNLRHLERFRAPGRVVAQAAGQLLDRVPWPVSVHRAISQPPWSRQVGIAALFHLVWQRLLHLDLTAPIRRHTVVAADPPAIVPQSWRVDIDDQARRHAW